ncbi:hypothetical protein ACHAXT_006327 [Thalassiosira profunda]
MATFESHLQNVMNELRALKATEDEFDGYQKIYIRCSHTIINWLYDVIDGHYHWNRELVHVAYNFFARWLHQKTHIEGNRMKCDVVHKFMVASLLLAAKTYSTPELDNSSGHRARVNRALVQLARNEFKDKMDRMQTEEELLGVLQWRLNPATVHQFSMKYAQLHPLSRDPLSRDGFGRYLYDTTVYQMELAIYESDLMMVYRPSVMAFAAILRAQDQFNESESDCTKEMKRNFSTLHGVLGLKQKEVEEARECLESFIPEVVSVRDYVEVARRDDEAEAAQAAARIQNN